MNCKTSYYNTRIFARGYNQLKDDLEEKADEIKLLKQELEFANKLLRYQEKRHVITSSPIITKRSKTREENDLGHVLEEVDK